MTLTRTRYGLPPGLVVAPLGDTWVVFSPLSGETMVLNDETAAILEVLREEPGDVATVCDTLAAELGLESSDLATSIGASWTQIIEAGLITEIAQTA